MAAVPALADGDATSNGMPADIIIAVSGVCMYAHVIIGHGQNGAKPDGSAPGRDAPQPFAGIAQADIDCRQYISNQGVIAE